MLGFEKTYTLPFKYKIPNYTSEFLKKKSSIRLWLKFFKRYLFLNLNSQKLLEIQSILPEHKNILWINMSAPSLGDSLMDLSSRIMLKDRNLDLFTDVKNAHLYKNDLIFSSVFTDKQQIKKNIYDLIIIDSYSTRSIRMKVNVAISTPFLGMFGYYNGPEVNRVLFSFHRMNKLLGYINNENEINCNAKCSISISSADKKIIQELKLPDNFIAIAIGGEWDYRTYQKWDSVIERIIKNDKKLNVVLLGSRNAKEIAKKIVYKNSYYNLYDYVDKFTFNQTSEIIKRAQVLLCCDGGLMHSANAVNTPIVALLAKLSPEMQLTNCIKAFSIYKNTNVNSISVDDICTKFQEASNFLNTNSSGK